MTLRFILLLLWLFAVCCFHSAALRRTDGEEHRNNDSRKNKSSQVLSYMNLLYAKKGVYGETHYTSTVAIGGTPRFQEFLVALSSSHSILWVADETCPYGNTTTCPDFCHMWCISLCLSSCCGPNSTKPIDNSTNGCGYRKRYSSKSSSTYVANGSASYDKYTGLVGIDTISIDDSGGSTIPHSVFGQTTSQTVDVGQDGLTPYNAYDGVFGIGYCDPPQGMASPLKSAYSAGLLSSPVTTWWLQRCETDNENDCWFWDNKIDYNGAVTFGGVDEVNCASEWKYYKPSAVAGCLYAIDMQSFSIGTQNVTSAKTYVAVFEQHTKTDYLLTLPSLLLGSLVKELAGKSANDGFEWISIVPCNADVPSIKLNFGGANYTIPPAALVGDRWKNGTYCKLNVQSSNATLDGHPLMYLGPRFMRLFCASFNFNTGEVGLANNIRDPAARTRPLHAPPTQSTTGTKPPEGTNPVQSTTTTSSALGSLPGRTALLIATLVLQRLLQSL